ncbi:MAG: Phospholipase/lecithinase/hemolysin [Rhodocyclaceae bacterium]|nr:Phospholipase/lecithinase/hemolysin [Rhodocyclaceae bacterium]
MREHKDLKIKQRVVVAAILAGVIGTTQAGNYSAVYFYGDSLTDSGIYRLILPNPSYDHFSTNPGKVWSQNLGANYGLAVSPAYAAQPNTNPIAFSPIASGNNFATGSARINLATITPPNAVLIPPVSTQVTDMLARGPLDRQALYAISGGHNDVFAQLSAPSNGAAVAGIITAANDLTAQVTRLQSAGARHLIVIGIMDMTKTPVASMPADVPDPVLLGNLVTSFNATLESGLAGKNLLYFNTGNMLNTVIANPAAYGFTNVTDAATPSSSLGRTPDPGKETGYLFADIRHPSAQFHKIMSDWIYSSLEGASRVGLMSQVPLGRSGAQWRSIDGRFNEFQNFGFKGQGFFVTGDYASSQKDAYAGMPSVEGSGGSLIMGYEKAFSDQLFAGITLGYGNAPFDLGNNQGTVKYNEWALSAFASHKFGEFYVNGLATYSWLDYESKRNIALGPFNTSEHGDTRGHQFGVKGQVGYNFTLGNIIHGPLVGLARERVNVNGFSEKSNSVTAMTFGDQTRESLRSRLGWQIAAETRLAEIKVRPYAQLSYDYEHKKDERTYSAGFVGGNSAMEMQTANRTGGYGTLLAGISAELSKGMRLGVGGSTTTNQPGANNTAINVTLSASF